MNTSVMLLHRLALCIWILVVCCTSIFSVDIDTVLVTLIIKKIQLQNIQYTTPTDYDSIYPYKHVINTAMS